MSPPDRNWSVSKILQQVGALGAALLVAAGCAVGPDYQRPQSEVPAAWEGVAPPAPSESSVATARPVALVEWWKAFDDPTLTSLVERAVSANLDLRLAEARIRQARAARGVAAAGLWPTVNASATYQRSLSGGARGSSITTATGTRTHNLDEVDLFQDGLDAAWELDIFGGVRRNIEASQADLQAAVEDRRDVLVSLIGELGTDYINLRGFQQQIAIARKNLEAQEHTAEITRRRHDVGFASGLDVANALAQVATTRSQIPVLESSARAAIYSLSILLGGEPTALLKELDTEGPIPPTPPEVPVGLPSDLLRRRPDIRRAEAQVHAATARIGVATADLFPKFSLTGSFGYSGDTASSLTHWENRFWAFGPTATWSIFDAGAIRWNIEVQNAIQEQTLLTYQQTVLTALKDVETALVAYAKEQEHRMILAEAVTNNQKAVDLSLKLYTAGRIDFLNVLNAQRSLYISEDALVLSVRNVSGNLIALYKALGGGWEETP
ncbi:MAG TPA: efflux transporter outer membrane subunit [Syntrophobacteria bacterium]|nr:efflux transporter outer membrane subunit [Syntrophobacteria bacterium]